LTDSTDQEHAGRRRQIKGLIEQCQRQAGDGASAARRAVLGDRFASEIRSAIRRILETPQRWRADMLEEDVRRCVVRVFPYSVLYTIEPDFILIVAVMHHKRQPGYWRYRLGAERK